MLEKVASWRNLYKMKLCILGNLASHVACLLGNLASRVAVWSSEVASSSSISDLMLGVASSHVSYHTVFHYIFKLSVVSHVFGISYTGRYSL